MRKIIVVLLLVIVATSSCRKLDVPVESQYVNGNFPVTAADFSAVIGPLYTQLSSKYCIEYFRMQELSTDEAILPARDGNWDDGGQYRQHHHHTWTKDHSNVKDIWAWGYGGINTCNRLLSLFDASPNSAAKTTALAEVKTMRAFFYFMMLDLYGNIPLVQKFPVTDLPTTAARADVFNFIEAELKSVYPSLPVKTSANAQLYYGKPTRGFAQALLAKLYINAEAYTGKAKYAETVSFCDSVIASNSYALDANFNAVFAPENGPQITETIFAIPYDPLLIPGQQFARFALVPYLCPKYGIPTNMSTAMSTTSNFYSLFNLPNDIRNNTWIIGKQFYFDGSPVWFPTKTKSLDQFYPGVNKDTLWQVEILKDLAMLPGKPFDLGNDIKAQCTGIRSSKFYPDKAIQAATRMGGNDMPVLRLADVFLMKAEAILRGAAATAVGAELQTPVVLVNKIRKRVGTTQVSAITLPEILDERARELSWECWRRNDLIRFGSFEIEYPIPGDVLTMDKRSHLRIFPIPATELALNPKLVQNPNY